MNAIIILSLVALNAITTLVMHFDRKRSLNAIVARTPVEFEKLEGRIKRKEVKPVDMLASDEIPFGL